jgi:predicted molibdopterin-dependent oxidoreductase YjgC
MLIRFDPQETEDVVFTFDGVTLSARSGDTIAAALLARGHWIFRQTAISGALRGPYCMMGACFDCLVEVDGQPNQQACMIDVKPGMRVRSQLRGAGSPA